MDRLWGEVLAVPAENIVALEGGESIEGFRVAHAPGHARHHVVYLHEASGDAYVGDVAGVRIPPLELTIPPTPPPDIDVEAWERSLDAVADWEPARVCLTHFGFAEDPQAQLDRARERLRWLAELARTGNREAFLRQVAAGVDEVADEDVALRHRQAAPPEQLWLGLERYWRKRAEAARLSD
jgi:glyoxylase-like metal-dependent hydrolase (beta-lactamase superfamily II)